MLGRAKATLLVFLIVVALSFTYVYADEIAKSFGSNEKISVESPDFEFSSQKILILNITQQDGFEQYLNVTWDKINETAFNISYCYDRDILAEIEVCNAVKDEKLRNECLTSLQGKYFHALDTKSINTSLNTLSSYPLTAVTSDIKSAQNSIDLKGCGSFKFEIDHYDKTDIMKSVGQQLKIGYNSVIVETVESTNDVGKYSSIDIDSNGWSHIAFHVYGFYDLRYCNNTQDGVWSCINIDTAQETGKFTSITLDDNNIPHIAYAGYDASLNFYLRYCNKTQGFWSCENISSDYDTSMSFPKTSITLDNANNVNIVYYNQTDNVTFYTNKSGSWVKTPVFFGVYGQSFSMVSDLSDYSHIFSLGYGGLRYCNNTLGTWSCDIISTSAGSYSGIDSIIKNGTLYIASGHNDQINFVTNSSGTFVSTLVRNDVSNDIGISMNSIGSVYIVYGNNNKLKICSNSTGNWLCSNVTSVSSTSSISLGYLGRFTSIKKGRLVDSIQYTNNLSVVIYNNTDLLYINHRLTYPIVNNLTSPLNLNVSRLNNLTLNCSAGMIDGILANFTLYTNSSSWHLNQTHISNGTSNYTDFTVDLIEGNYTWNCLACDDSYHCDFASANSTFFINNTVNYKFSNCQRNRMWLKENQTVDFFINVTNELGNATNVQAYFHDASGTGHSFRNLTYMTQSTWNFTYNFTQGSSFEGNFSYWAWIANSTWNASYAPDIDVNTYPFISCSFVTDRTLPDVEVWNRSNNFLSGNNMNISFNTTLEKTFDYTTVIVQNPDATVFGVWTPLLKNTTVEFNTTTASQVGNYTFVTVINDKAGNINTSTKYIGVGKLITNVSSQISVLNYSSEGTAWGYSSALANNSYANLTTSTSINLTVNGYLDSRSGTVHYNLSRYYKNWTYVNITNSTYDEQTITWVSDNATFTNNPISTYERQNYYAVVDTRGALQYSYQESSSGYRFMFQSNLTNSYNIYARVALPPAMQFDPNVYHIRYWGCSGTVTPSTYGCTGYTLSNDIYDSNLGSNTIGGYPVNLKTYIVGDKVTEMSFQTNQSDYLIEMSVVSGPQTPSSGGTTGGGTSGGGGGGGLPPAVIYNRTTELICPSGYKLSGENCIPVTTVPQEELEPITNILDKITEPLFTFTIPGGNTIGISLFILGIIIIIIWAIYANKSWRAKAVKGLHMKRNFKL